MKGMANKAKSPYIKDIKEDQGEKLYRRYSIMKR